MTQHTLGARVAALELRNTEVLKMLRATPPKEAWRRVVGMFADDPHIDELHREIHRIRDEDRKASGCRYDCNSVC